MVPIFVSQSRRDTLLAPWFDSVCARESVEAIRFHFEFVSEQPIQVLQQKLWDSSALFLLLSDELTKVHTGNWVCAEAGIARGLRKPIWLLEKSDRPVRFPVPFVDYYVRVVTTTPAQEEESFRLVRGFVRCYAGRVGAPPPRGARLRCPNNECQAIFEIFQNHYYFDRCPVCCTPCHWNRAVVNCSYCHGLKTIGHNYGCPYCDSQGAFSVDMDSSPCCSCQGERMLPPVVEGATETPCPDCKGTGFSEWMPVSVDTVRRIAAFPSFLT